MDELIEDRTSVSMRERLPSMGGGCWRSCSAHDEMFGCAAIPVLVSKFARASLGSAEKSSIFISSPSLSFGGTTLHSSHVLHSSFKSWNGAHG
jgi:hypothetical protein